MRVLSVDQPTIFYQRNRVLLLEGLRTRIRAIERSHGIGPAPPSAWTFGAAEIDRLLPSGGLTPSGLHEIKPAHTSDTSSALAFALRLAARRVSSMGACAPLLWCRPAHAAAESGRLYGPGLAGIGLAPSALIIAETDNDTSALWAMEEGLGSGSLAAVLGQIEQVGLTPSRRLSLAGQAHQTPAIVVSHPRTASAAAALTRWRVGSVPSATHPFDRTLPGNPRLRITPERCRHGAPELEHLSLNLEWCDETLRFRVAAGVADLPALPHRAGRRPG